MFPFSIILGFGTGFQPVAGFNWGAKEYDRVLESHRFASRLALIGAGIMAVILIAFADPIIVAFAGTDPEMREFGKLCIILQSIALPVHAWVAVVNMLCSGLGNASGAFLLATSRQGSCMIPILYPLAYFFAETGLAAVQAAADVLSLVFAIPIAIHMTRKIKNTWREYEAQTGMKLQ
jgi:Na+-driven multidrug efflux pump